MRKPPMRNDRPDRWREKSGALPPFALVNRLARCQPLRRDQDAEVFRARRIALRVIGAALRYWPSLRDETPGLADQAAVEAAATYDPAHGIPFAAWAAYVAGRVLRDARKVDRRIGHCETHRSFEFDERHHPGLYHESADPLAERAARMDFETLLAAAQPRIRPVLEALYQGAKPAHACEAHGIPRGRGHTLIQMARASIQRRFPDPV